MTAACWMRKLMRTPCVRPTRRTSCGLSKVGCEVRDCQSPPTRSRRLASGLCRNSAYRSRHAALASLSDASGASDKCPVLAQHAGQGAVSTKSVLPEHGLLAQNLATQLERYRVGPLVSLLRGEVPKPTQEYSRTGIKNRKGGGASSSG